MVVSAQFRLSGFYTRAVQRVTEENRSPGAFLAQLIGLSAVLSGVLVNDIVCLALTPIVLNICARRRLDPRPYLLSLACASNIGSAATLIGNPQNILIGSILHMNFRHYLITAAIPTMVNLGILWLFVAWSWRGRWETILSIPEVSGPRFIPWQALKGLMVLTGILTAFLFTPMPREIIAIAGAGLLLSSRSMHSRDILGLVDWQLIVLFISLFVIHKAMALSGNLSAIEQFLTGLGMRLEHPAWLFVITVGLSNLVSNVPAVMVLLPYARHPSAGTLLAMVSTLAGNLLVVGSIANIIVVEQASRLGVTISWKDHAKIGIPITLATLLTTAVWLVILS